MSRHPIRWILAIALVVGGVRWVWNSNEWSGPVLMTLDSSHGVHLNDWLSIAMWMVAFAIACPIWVRMLTSMARRAVAQRDR
jgi:hypothetical protein